jgi:CspA family cold shock protein
VKWFNSRKGFGFHCSPGKQPGRVRPFSAITGSGYRSLDDGQRVEVDITQGQKGPAGGERQGHQLILQQLFAWPGDPTPYRRAHRRQEHGVTTINEGAAHPQT